MTNKNSKAKNSIDPSWMEFLLYVQITIYRNSVHAKLLNFGDDLVGQKTSKVYKKDTNASSLSWNLILCHLNAANSNRVFFYSWR